MSPLGGPAFWSCGGEVLAVGGRALARRDAEALEGFYAGLLDQTPDPRARDYLGRRRAELAAALALAGRWRRAAAPS